MLALALAALLPPQADPAAAEPLVHASVHYRLTAPADFDRADDWLALAEAVHARLAEHFGAEPPAGAPLEVEFFADQSGYRARLAEERIDPRIGDAGGVYWTGTRRAYLWRQPSWSFTQHLFVHELVHQFHFLAVMDNRARCPGWYAEGLAEHFAFHAWDGATYRPGLSDLVRLERNLPEMAAAARARRLDLLALLEGRLGGPKPESWAAVHWLLAGPDAGLREAFRAQERRMWAGLPFDVGAVLSHDAEREQTLDRALTWLGGLPTTWRIEWVGWDARGDQLVGESGVVALIRLDDLAARGGLRAEVRAPGRAGLVVGFRSTAAFLLVYLDPRGAVWLAERLDGGWRRHAAATVAPRQAWQVDVRTDPAGLVRVLLDGAPVLEVRVDPALVDGPPGLFADGCRATFDAIARRPWPER